MRNDFPTTILVFLTLVYFSVRNIKGKSLGQRKESAEYSNVTRDTLIKDLQQDLKKVLHFIDHLTENYVTTNKNPDDKSIPDQATRKHMFADESVITATAQKAAKAVKESQDATLKTQKGVKDISKGLIALRKCLKTFEDTITV